MRSRGHGPTRCQSERCSNHAASCASAPQALCSDDGERDIREPRTTRTAPTTAPSVCRHTAIVVMNSGTSRILKRSTFSYASSASGVGIGIGGRLVRRSGRRSMGQGQSATAGKPESGAKGFGVRVRGSDSNMHPQHYGPLRTSSHCSFSPCYSTVADDARCDGASQPRKAGYHSCF